MNQIPKSYGSSSTLWELLEAKKDWERAGKCMMKMSIIQEEKNRYLPTYYSVLADLDTKIKEKYQVELVNDDDVVRIESPKVKSNQY